MRTAVRCGAGALLVATIVAGLVGWRVVRAATADPALPAGAADAIVVLGAAQYDGDPSPVYRARLDHAKDLYDHGVAPRIVTIGGGKSADRTTEGAAGRDYLLSAGLPAEALVAVGTGSDTLVSLRAARTDLAARGWDDVVLVTDPGHAARASLMARDLGFDARVSPVRIGPAVDPDLQPRYLFRETLATLFYLAVGGSSGLGSPVL